MKYKALILLYFITNQFWSNGQNLHSVTLDLTIDYSLFEYRGSDLVAKRMVSINNMPKKYVVTLPKKCKKVDSSTFFCSKLQIEQADKQTPFLTTTLLFKYITKDSVHLFINTSGEFNFYKAKKRIILSRTMPTNFVLSDFNGYSHFFRILFIGNSGSEVSISEFRTYSVVMPNTNQRFALHKIIPTDSLHPSDEILVIESNQKYVSGIRSAKRSLIGKTKHINLNGLSYEVQINWRNKSLTLAPLADDNVSLYITNSNSFDTSLKYKDLLGKKRYIKDLQAGEKYILIDFWGLWCSQCIKDIPKLKKIDSLYSEKLSILSLNSKDAVSKINEYTINNNISWRQGKWSYNLQQYFGQNGYPYYILITPKNEINPIQRISLSEVENILLSN